MSWRGRSVAVHVLWALALVHTVTQVAATQVVTQNLYGFPTGLAYYMSVNIGTAKQTRPDSAFRLLVDTGSSNTAVVTSDCCAYMSNPLFTCSASPTCTASSRGVNVNYVTGSWSGVLAKDVFSSSELGNLTDVDFVMILKQEHFVQPSYDGIVGLAFKDVASPSSNPPPSYLDVVQKQHNLPNTFALQMCGALQSLLVNGTDVDYHAGSLVIGGNPELNDLNLHQGKLHYTPLLFERWYNVIVTDVGVQGKSLGIPCSRYNSPRAIIDSGTSNIAFPSDVYNIVLQQLKANMAKVVPDFPAMYFDDELPCCDKICDPRDNSSKLLQTTSIYVSFAVDSESDSMQSIKVEIPPEYIWRPILQSSNNNGATQCRVFGISEGDITLLGDVFMDGLYTFHDRENDSIGLAVAANCPNKVTPTKKINVAAGASNACDCIATDDRANSLLTGYFPGSKRCFFWFWWMYVVVVSVVVILVCTGIFIWIWWKRRQLARRNRRSNALDDSLLTPHQHQMQAQDQAGVPQTTVDIHEVRVSKGVRPSTASTFRSSSLPSPTPIAGSPLTPTDVPSLDLPSNMRSGSWSSSGVENGTALEVEVSHL